MGSDSGRTLVCLSHDDSASPAMSSSLHCALLRAPLCGRLANVFRSFAPALLLVVILVCACTLSLVAWPWRGPNGRNFRLVSVRTDENGIVLMCSWGSALRCNVIACDGPPRTALPYLVLYNVLHYPAPFCCAQRTPVPSCPALLSCSLVPRELMPDVVVKQGSFMYF